jgi:Methylmalonic aciduria and homocystinuria type D protein
MIEFSIHSPSDYICTHRENLLPDWTLPVRSILVVLQPARMELVQHTPETEDQKQQLRQRFIEFGLEIVQKLRQMGHMADLFDPRTGLPVLSQAGSLRLDDVAVVRSTLGYPIACLGGCSGIVHPTWGRAVYPSILISSADSGLVESAIATVEGLLETHHSLSG